MAYKKNIVPFLMDIWTVQSSYTDLRPFPLACYPWPRNLDRIGANIFQYSGKTPYMHSDLEQLVSTKNDRGDRGYLRVAYLNC